uniref:Uncharacterized protein n=1 Tax=Arundo donax TaxID=35708 RepID=A0A0A9AGZ5_ARUDO
MARSRQWMFSKTSRTLTQVSVTFGAWTLPVETAKYLALQ